MDYDIVQGNTMKYYVFRYQDTKRLILLREILGAHLYQVFDRGQWYSQKIADDVSAMMIEIDERKAKFYEAIL